LVIDPLRSDNFSFLDRAVRAGVETGRYNWHGECSFAWLEEISFRWWHMID